MIFLDNSKHSNDIQLSTQPESGVNTAPIRVEQPQQLNQNQTAQITTEMAVSLMAQNH